ncbi:MAG: hypothetical protein ACJ75B_16015 [Flavisolibacter sp.]
MRTQLILFKVYLLATVTVSSVMLFICILLGYNLRLCALVLRPALAIGLAPATALFIVFCLLQKIRISRVASWILLMALMTILQWIAAFMLVDHLPGDKTDLAGLGILGGYSGILGQALSISQIFNSYVYETK